jgi:hypothetical protein
MKRSILVATFLVTAAGVASANLLTTATSPQNPTPPLPQAQQATPAPVPAKTAHAEPMPSATSPTLAKKAPAPTVQRAALEPRQAPVPLQMKPRPAVNLPTIEAKAEDKPGETPADASTDGFNEKAAKAAIEADGYKSVKVLRKGANGVWHASGLRGSTTVMLTVDASGSVRAD